MTARQLMTQPDVPKRLNVSPWYLRNLVYDLTITLGAVSIENKEEITFLGEWKGKASGDYFKELVKVRFSDEERHNSVSKELARCREIGSLLT